MLDMLQLRTISGVTGVMGCLMALVMFFQRRSYPPSIHGLGHWAAAPLVAFASAVLFTLRGKLPDLLSLGLANALMFAGAVLFVAGSYRFFERPLSARAGLLLGLTGLAIIAFMHFFTGPYGYRVLFMGLLLGGVGVWHARLIWSQPVQSFATRFTGVVLLLSSIIILARAVTAPFMAPQEGLFTPSPMQVVYLLGLAFGTLLTSIGTVLMAAEHLRQELERLITHDSLTGALTRRALFTTGEAELSRARRQGRPLSVLMLDLDHFKQINDEHGHLVGDRVLADFVERAHAVLRRPAVLGRYGGEEFVALLPDTDAEQALAVAERLRASPAADAALPRCHVSIGVATAQFEDTLDSLINRADAGLYQAKARGRNQVVQRLAAS
ncbi:diguanylate cyclase (GGDEF)-like protein [Pelomonas saccharophila]|uniref:diguanylate cyclase n=2 Tax=Roseateles saccharophilus TaxID=304 RepID=A0ABU1YNU4_ROSSA|nr:diguanylate cyclase (GGDEF)-like protein [Roseateles saccharophilus]